MTEPVIRRCAPGDWGEVRRLHLKLALEIPVVVDVDLNEILARPDTEWREYVDRCTTDPTQALFVAQEDTRCVGMGHIGLEGRLARLSMLFVEGDRRRRGVGAGLVRAQERWAERASAERLACHIPEAGAASRLAEALGWTRREIFFTRHGRREGKWNRTVGDGPEARRRN